MKTVEILLPNHLPHGFDYAVPEGMALAAGDYVSVPFGNRELPGVVWGAGTHAGAKLKPVTAHHAHLPPMEDSMRRFIDWVAWYTHSPRGAVLKMALPLAEALKAPNSRERSSLSRELTSPSLPVLSAEQRAGAEKLAEKLSAGYSVTLLDGITGSGKTEVYFDTIARAIEGGGQALVLLPEISLSVQWLERFRARFGFAPVIWHSGLAVGARKHGWRAVAQGEARVVVGARSALFLPYRRLQLIIADEEHDGSYKQEDGVIYHARDMAVARARQEKIPAVLVSATPSLETWHNVTSGRYGEVKLAARHGGAVLPEVMLLDMRSAPLERGSFLSQPLKQALAQGLACGHQSLLFLNRRGYAPLVLCRACGHRFQCPQCTSWLVLHKKGVGGQRSGVGKEGDRLLPDPRPLAPGRLQCHHCGFTVPEPEKCPTCQAEDSLQACGPGVERIAEEVAACLPQARVEVLASDSAETFSELQARIHAMQQGAVDILIGTQMIAKGHHFENLALVGIVDADLGLAGGDLRGAERTWQLLHQVSGRAGRAQVAGRVMIQSYAPEHPVMRALAAGDREGFMKLELDEREHSRMPPFSRLCALIVEGAHDDAAANAARSLARAAPRHADVRLLGPAPAPLFMLRGKYRYRLLLRAPRSFPLQAYLTDWLGNKKFTSSLRLKVDVDPQSFL